MCILVYTWEKYLWEIKEQITVTASRENNWIAEDWGGKQTFTCKAF